MNKKLKKNESNKMQKLEFQIKITKNWLRYANSKII